MDSARVFIVLLLSPRAGPITQQTAVLQSRDCATHCGAGASARAESPAALDVERHGRKEWTLAETKKTSDSGL